MVGSKLMRGQQRKFMIDFGTWHVEVSQHDYWMLLVSIGPIVLEILVTLVVGLAEIDSSLLGLMLWASLFYYYLFGQQKCISTTCDPCTVWREILTVTLLRSDFVWLNGRLGGLDRGVMGYQKRSDLSWW